MRRSSVVGATLLLLAAGPAGAQVASIGPFVGAEADGFESYGPILLVSSLGVMSGNAQVSCQQGGSAIQVTGAWSLFSVASPHSGNLFLGSAGDDLRWDFWPPARRFGGYFANISDKGGATVDISLDGGGFAGTFPLGAPPGGAWHWNGWETTGPAISRIDINGAFAVAGFLMMDDAEFDAAIIDCYPECSGDGLLTVADFGCFQTKFVLADPYADCNGDGQLAVSDFGCFQTKFVVGCP